jgi:hypothetical protein
MIKQDGLLRHNILRQKYYHITFRVSVASDVREKVRDLGSPLRFMLKRSSLVECVSVLHGTCLQCAEFFFIHQYVQPCFLSTPICQESWQNQFIKG